MLSLRFGEVDFKSRMVLPCCHEGETKQSLVSFYNEEAEKALNEYLDSRKNKDGKLFRIGTHPFLDLWKRANEKIMLHITPQSLREWFCTEMVSKGVSDSYVDAFCGRVPRSILAKHYLDYSPEKLKRIYDKADLKVLC
jgi:integrase